MARPNVSVSADENFRSRCTQEKKAFDEWPVKWGWILEECNIRNQKLEAIKKKAVMRKGNVETDTRTVLPFPITTQKEIGWLSSKKEFQLEIYGGYVTKLPIEKSQ